MELAYPTDCMELVSQNDNMHFQLFHASIQINYDSMIAR